MTPRANAQSKQNRPRPWHASPSAPSSDADVAGDAGDLSRITSRAGVGDLGDYEPEPLDAEDLKRRRKTMRRKRLPHLVAELDGVVAGYAYAVPFRKRPAYRYTVKHSIYVHPDSSASRHRPAPAAHPDRGLRARRATGR